MLKELLLLMDFPAETFQYSQSSACVLTVNLRTSGVNYTVYNSTYFINVYFFALQRIQAFSLEMSSALQKCIVNGVEDVFEHRFILDLLFNHYQCINV
jgi:hypothetical protein